MKDNGQPSVKGARLPCKKLEKPAFGDFCTFSPILSFLLRINALELPLYLFNPPLDIREIRLRAK